MKAILVRLALSAARVIDAALGVGATLLAIALTRAHDVAAPQLEATSHS
jgi:hypothetical protein